MKANHPCSGSWLRPSAIFSALLLCAAIPLPAAPTGVTPPLPMGAAAELGFAPERLDWLNADFRKLVDDRRCSGFVTLLVRHGRIADWRAYGWRDIGARAPMERDTIFRIFSNTKLVTSVGAMILFEQGKLDLNAPLEKYLPELKDRMVLTGGTADAPQLVPAREPVRVWHLLTHTSGYAYEFNAGDVLAELYRRADLSAARSGDEFVTRVAKLPLALQPGTEFRYSLSTDLLGALLERVSGQSLEDFLQARIFRPLRMRDTSFGVAPEKLARLAKVYHRLPAGGLVESPKGPATLPEPDRGFASGGGGLFSTAGDYARFGQMLLNGGELDGVRILGRKTVAYMTLNHLRRTAKPTHAYSEARGFGLGPEVVIDPAKDPHVSSLGQFGWSGAATTHCQIDPAEDLVALAFFQHEPMNETGVFGRFADGYSAALVDRPVRAD